MRLYRSFKATAAVCSLLLVGACGMFAESSTSSSSSGFNPPDIEAQSKLGPTEGQVNLVSWAGYVEDGSSDPKADWAPLREDGGGASVHNKVAASSDEMVKLMKSGSYDALSASGDASLRLIASGEVAP